MKPELLAEEAQKVLEENSIDGSYTIPANGMYPHQWLWDSCFIAIGLSHFDVSRAKKEVLSLLKGQWANGMVPHMIFDSSREHLQDRNLWRSWLNPSAPDDVTTSGITQPPLLAEAVVKIGEKLSKPERRSWYERVFPALLKYHQWFYNERDPHNEGLIVQIHPWETGLDNTPPWMHELHGHQLPLWIRAIEKLRLESIVNLFRRDTKYVHADMRLSAIDALALYSMQRRLRRKRFDIDKILPHAMVSIEDLSFNSILIKANQHLEQIAKTIGKKLDPELVAGFRKTEESLDQLWDAYSGQYYSRNFVTHKLIKIPSIAALLPLYSGAVTKDRAEELVSLLTKKDMFKTKYPIPTVPPNSDWFHEFAYWQGPTWINTNWLVVQGLRNYGYDELAKELAKTTIELVEQAGFYEYFSALSGEPAGIANFSWTAALTIDLIDYQQSKT